MFYMIFILGGVFACGHVLGQVHGFNQYEKYERESKVWVSK
jgi:hypothetical protein